jgi:excisionase family DNA binding protein
LTITEIGGNVKKIPEYYGGKMTARDKQNVEKEFDSIRDFCQRTGKCYRTIHRAIKEGKIRVVRFGGSVMIPRHEVERLLQRGF